MRNPFLTPLELYQSKKAKAPKPSPFHDMGLRAEAEISARYNKGETK
tara:strand:- start:1946 stop:2086 length:141 start_codon:yes stop_codon:yes gene_type:complete